MSELVREIVLLLVVYIDDYNILYFSYKNKIIQL